MTEIDYQNICICEFGPVLGSGRIDSSRCPVHDMTHAELLHYAALEGFEVAKLETTITEVTKLAKEPIVNQANSEHDDALSRLVRIIEVLEEGE